jgi:hypothetical protein
MRIGVPVICSPNDALARTPGEAVLEINVESPSFFPEFVIALVTIKGNLQSCV